MFQDQPARFSSEDKKFLVFCDSDMPLGVAHDHVMRLKGELIERMQKAHVQELEAAKAHMADEQEDKPEVEACAPCEE